MQVLLQYQSKVITLSGRRFITVSGILLHYRAVITLSGVFYYIIGQLLQYRAFITLSVGTDLRRLTDYHGCNIQNVPIKAALLEQSVESSPRVFCTQLQKCSRDNNVILHDLIHCPRPCRMQMVQLWPWMASWCTQTAHCETAHFECVYLELLSWGPLCLHMYVSVLNIYIYIYDLLLSLDDGKISLLASLDLSAAFDTIDHNILLHRLEHDFGLSGTVLDWFSSYLSGRNQSVSVHSHTSVPASVSCGVLQGSVLGPILFVLCTTPISTVIDRHSILHHSYADDTQLQVMEWYR